MCNSVICHCRRTETRFEMAKILMTPYGAREHNRRGRIKHCCFLPLRSTARNTVSRAQYPRSFIVMSVVLKSPERVNTDGLCVKRGDIAFEKTTVDYEKHVHGTLEPSRTAISSCLQTRYACTGCRKLFELITYLPANSKRFKLDSLWLFVLVRYNRRCTVCPCICHTGFPLFNFVKTNGVTVSCIEETRIAHRLWYCGGNRQLPNLRRRYTNGIN